MFIFTIADILGIVMTVILSIVVIFNYSKQAIKQYKCKHDGDYCETRSCDAICMKCGKNLGFIGSWRETLAKREGKS